MSGFTLQFQDGDFKLGDGNIQDINQIMFMGPGNWKQYPTTGLDMDYYLNSPLKLKVRRDVINQINDVGTEYKDVQILDTGEVKISV